MLCAFLTGFSQVDTTAQRADTIKIGGMIIIKKPGEKGREIKRERDLSMPNRKSNKPTNVSTNWWIFDLGLNNVNDRTSYGSTAANAYMIPVKNKECSTSYQENQYSSRCNLPELHGNNPNFSFPSI